MFGTLLDILGTVLKSANLAYALQVTNANGFHRLLSLLTHPIRDVYKPVPAKQLLRRTWIAYSYTSPVETLLRAGRRGKPSLVGRAASAATPSGLGVRKGLIDA